MNRRQFIRNGAAAVGAIAVAPTAQSSTRRPSRSVTPCLFSKALHHVSVDALPDVLNELGIGAVDLTCRPNGHIPPEEAETALPATSQRLREAGISVPMLTTAIISADDPHTEAIIRTAAAEGIRHLKLGYYSYGDLNKLPATLANVKARLRDLAAMCGHFGVTAGFHNHSGYVVGAAMWDLWHLLEAIDGRALGSYFDFMHATVEGGYAGWMIGLYRLRPRLVMAAVKDYQWHRNEKGQWRPMCVPLGTGMVSLQDGLRKLGESGFTGPLSLHIEYGEHLPAVGSGSDREKRASIQRDWSTLMELGRRIGLFS